jgi:hypothetical protein
MPRQCDLLSRKLVDEALIPMINTGLSVRVSDDTDLRNAQGLNMGDEDIRDELLPVVLRTVQNHGCRLLSFGSPEILSCHTVGDVVDAVWNDLNQPAAQLSMLSAQLAAISNQAAALAKHPAIASAKADPLAASPVRRQKTSSGKRKRPKSK